MVARRELLSPRHCVWCSSISPLWQQPDTGAQPQWTQVRVQGPSQILKAWSTLQLPLPFPVAPHYFTSRSGYKLRPGEGSPITPLPQQSLRTGSL